uniref:Uncharacterized protein n=1 Tax=Arundo donax TaxID=35708 RepID=A0A0A9DJZ9_ARUDO
MGNFNGGYPEDNPEIWLPPKGLIPPLNAVSLSALNWLCSVRLPSWGHKLGELAEGDPRWNMLCLVSSGSKSWLICCTKLRRAPPGRLGSNFTRVPAISLLFNDLRAASAALTS